MNFSVSVGIILKEYLKSRKISQKDFSIRAGVSDRQLRRVIKGESGLTPDFALKIEKVMPDTRAEFWLSLDAHNKLHKLRGE